MKIAVRLEYDRFDELAEALQREVAAIVEETAYAISTDVVTRIANDEKSGRIYKRKNGKIHQASAPGEYPASDTGALMDSYTEGVKPVRSDGLTWMVGSNQEYAAPLEYGHAIVRNGVPVGFVAARPHLTPSVERMRPEFVKRLKQLEERLK